MGGRAAETSINAILTNLPEYATVRAANRALVETHREDERLHATMFLTWLTGAWSAWSRHQQAVFTDSLVEGLSALSMPDVRSLDLMLTELGVGDAAPAIPAASTPRHERDTKNLIALARRLGIGAEVAAFV